MSEVTPQARREGQENLLELVQAHVDLSTGRIEERDPIEVERQQASPRKGHAESGIGAFVVRREKGQAFHEDLGKINGPLLKGAGA